MAAAKALNAVVTSDIERTLAEAATVDRRAELGDDMPLAGVPVVVKDNIWVEGWRVTKDPGYLPISSHRATPLRSNG